MRGEQKTKVKAKTETTMLPVLAVRDAVHFPGLVNTLHIVREPSLRALRKAMDTTRMVVVLSQRDMAVEDPKANDLVTVGTLSDTLQAIPLPDTSLRVALRGMYRVRAKSIVERNGCFWAEIEELVEIPSEGVEVDALARACVETYTQVVQLSKDIPPESLQGVVHADNIGVLADTLVHHLPVKPQEKQALLEELDQAARLEKVLSLLKRELQVLELNVQIHERVERELGDSQREFYLREQLRIIQNELREREDRLGEAEEYREKIDKANMTEEAASKANAELRRLDRAPGASPEGMVIRNYLDTLISLPWNEITTDRLDVDHASRVLDEQHYGLEKVKDRILDYLAVRQITGSLRGPILCFAGPPGVGKTSLGRSIAEAMGRRFVRIALGGVRDEAEIRGHRRTYVGSMPGRIIQALRDCGSRNPVIVLDEIDKLDHGVQGDPTSALLEALDPEQNGHFTDHYIEASFDLSGVLFIATANLLENIPSPLRDRMETIQFPAYTDDERIQIARNFLFPKEREEHGLKIEQVQLPDETVETLVRDYTREAGVRSLHRHIGTLCRKSARQIAEGGETPVVLDNERTERFLGRPRFRLRTAEGASEIGVAWGLVVSQVGGSTLPIEVAHMAPLGERPALQLTGSLGDVMKESAMTALSHVQASHRQLGAKAPYRFDVHVHVPEGAIPKDGPSAGLTLTIALASAFTGRRVKEGLATTGEVTLRGRVLAVGGIRDKVLAAAAAGFTDVILPQENVVDLEDVPTSVRDRLTFHPVTRASEAWEVALEPVPEGEED